LGPVTPKFKLGRDFCTMNLAAKFHHPMFSRSEVIMLPKNRQTNKQMPLKTSTSLCCATLLHTSVIEIVHLELVRVSVL